MALPIDARAVSGLAWVLADSVRVSRRLSRALDERWRHADRNDSSDSRQWGEVPKKYVIGKVQLRWWPIPQGRFF
jgi:hypothetical protein